ncbi:hypothetical protein D1AOALGA4SA_11342 [Olavius algarvensis Delta 1 endosymbiont]|nr:hypothetical protein D1AOALGA4SA_11342 [Olavius algarvensis Delta 1 endosymbiont]
MRETIADCRLRIADLKELGNMDLDSYQISFAQLVQNS